MKITTKFWYCENGLEWGERYLKVVWMIAFICAINIAYGYVTGKLTLSIFNFIFWIFFVIIIISYYKWKKELLTDNGGKDDENATE